MVANVEQMAYVGETPWHGIGKSVTDISIQKNARLFMKEALGDEKGNIWEVTTEPAFDGFGNNLKDLGQLVRRTDNKQILAIVGPRWTPLSNVAKFDWFQPMLDNGPVFMETGGSLDEGRKVFALARIEGLEGKVGTLKDGTDDRIVRYIMLSDSNDGTMAVRAGFTDIRIVCQNTLRAAIRSEASKLLRFRHNSNVEANLSSIGQILDVANQEFATDLKTYNELKSRGVSPTDLRKYVKTLFVPEGTNDDDISTRLNNIMANVVKLAESGQGNDGSTWFDAYNGVTEYYSWVQGRNNDNRMNSVWFGTNAAKIENALELAIQMSEGKTAS